MCDAVFVQCSVVWVLPGLALCVAEKDHDTEARVPLMSCPPPPSSSNFSFFFFRSLSVRDDATAGSACVYIDGETADKNEKERQRKKRRELSNDEQRFEQDWKCGSGKASSFCFRFSSLPRFSLCLSLFALSFFSFLCFFISVIICLYLCLCLCPCPCLCLYLCLCLCPCLCLCLCLSAPVLCLCICLFLGLCIACPQLLTCRGTLLTSRRLTFASLLM